MTQVFADGVAEISIVSGVVRIEFFVTEKKSQNGQPQPRVVASLAMPLDGFANSVAVMNGLVEKMVKDGVLKQRQGGPAVGGASPNFQ